MAAKQALYIVDGSYYIYRAYYALRGLSNSKGFPTNGLYGFVGMLRKLVDDEQPSHLLVTFDTKGGSFRNDLYPEYKANRAATPEDLVPQLPIFRDIVRAYNVPVLEMIGYEADDVIGTLANQAAEQGLDVVLVSGDKDLTQLLSDRISMLDTMRDKRTRPDDVRARYQVGPERIPDLLGLMGDSSDNIPGVPGVGEKTAAKLLGQYGSLEGLYANLEAIRGKLKERLTEHRDDAFLSRRLATIEVDLDVAFDEEASRLSKPDLPALVALFNGLEFDRHLEDLEKRYGVAAVSGAQGETDSAPVAVDKAYRAVVNRDDLAKIAESIRQAGRVSLVVELGGNDPMRAPLVGLGLSWASHEGVYLPIQHQATSANQLSESVVREVLGPVLADPQVAIVGHDTKQASVALARHGLALEGVVFDTMLASYCLDPSRRSHTVESLAWDFLGYETTRYSDIAGRGAKQKTFDFIEVEAATDFAAEDADVIRLLSEPLGERLEDDSDLRKLHDDLELPLSAVLARMERHGILVDAQFLRELSQEFVEREAAIEREIYELAGVEFKINSPKQLAVVLFDRLELPVVKRTKTGPSTDASVLEKLSREHPLPQRVLDWRSLDKLRSTYTDALPSLVNPETGRIHTEFRQAVAVTGRLSSNNPNLQNIPVRTAEGRRIREAFAAPAGMVLLSADYSQVELRLLAHMSGDPVLLDAFRRGQDIHARTAAELFDVAPEAVDKGQRSVAKTINFGLLYGMGVVRLSRELNIPRKEATAFIDRYRERIAGVRDFLDELVESARTTGFARTMLGRRRPLPELKSRNRGQQALGERLAVNTPIQGTAADLIKLAMVRVQKRLDGEGLRAHMLLQVHDELVFEVDEADTGRLRALVVAEMEGAMQLDVPLSVDVSVGANWAAL